jgi:hypothetical protein
MRLQAEEQAQLTAEREVWAAFALERDRMTALDQRVFAMWAAVIAVVYLLVITGFDVRHGGVDGTVRWLVRAARCVRCAVELRSRCCDTSCLPCTLLFVCLQELLRLPFLQR